MTGAMRAFLVAAVALLSSAAALVLVRARRLKGRHRAVFGAPVPHLEAAAERLVDAPRALYHGTRFADGAALLPVRWRDACVGDLWCTAEGIFLRREDGGAPLVIPLGWIDDASLVRGHAPIAATDLPMLRVRWQRGGESLLTDFSLPGGMANLEKLRREIHLRQGRDAVATALAPFFERAGELGK
jgi:hypothetical protein